MVVNSQKPIVVTGASSFIGSNVVKALLSRNHVVRGTTRDPSAPKMKALRSLPNNKNLTLTKVDLLKPESFPAVLEGAHALLHVATPVILGIDGKFPYRSVEEGMEKQMKPTLDGTRALFETAVAAGVRKIVLTSSAAAICKVPNITNTINESCWSEEVYFRSRLEESGAIYNLSKLLQEKLAWKLADELQFKLVCINPTYVLGPVVLPALCETLSMMSRLAKGLGMYTCPSREGMIPNYNHCFVDVREVAEAHVLALEREDAEGRYYLISQSVHCTDIYKTLLEHEAFRKYPAREIDTTQELNHPVPFDNSKLRALGVKEIPWEETIKATAESLVVAGVV